MSASSQAGATARDGAAHPGPGPRRPRPGAATAALTLTLTLTLVLVLLASCGGARPAAAWHRPSGAAVTTSSAPTTSAPVTVPPPTTPPTTAPPTTVVPPTTTPPTTVRAAPPTTAAPRPRTPAPLLVTRLNGVGSATQVIAVSAASYGTTVATFTAYQETAGGWQQVFGPWQADVGYDGFAPPGQKREGDGRTPSGSYGFDFFFGVLGDPGVRFPYRPVTGPDIVWADDPSSTLYNQWVDTATQDAGAQPEPMDQTPAYDYGAVIAYNMDPVVPGAGSAIFLHVSTGGPTAGCVSLPPSELLSVLRWLDPADQPRIVMGTAATITS